jgi:hypothetical protein
MMTLLLWIATPGVVAQTDTAILCRPGYATRARVVDTLLYRRLRRPIYRAYGVTAHSRTPHQFDHLIPVELGGATAQGNLWPEPSTKTGGAHRKDLLENRLRWRVCAGKYALSDVQRAIARDWVAADRAYP